MAPPKKVTVNVQMAAAAAFLYPYIVKVLKTLDNQGKKANVTSIEAALVSMFGDSLGSDLGTQLRIALQQLGKDGRLLKDGNQFKTCKPDMKRGVTKAKKASKVKRSLKIATEKRAIKATAAKPVPIPPSAAKPVKAASKLVKATIKVAVGKPAGIKKPHTPVPRKAKALPSSRAEKVTTRKKA